jgi:hypothetical protein
MRRERGFLPALFDVRFSTFVTAKMIRGLYRLIIVITVNGTLFAWLLAWWLPGWLGILKFLCFAGAPAAALVWLAICRMILEHMIAIYAIQETLTTIARNISHDERRM